MNAQKGGSRHTPVRPLPALQWTATTCTKQVSQNASSGHRALLRVTERFIGSQNASSGYEMLVLGNSVRWDKVHTRRNDRPQSFRYRVDFGTRYACTGQQRKTRQSHLHLNFVTQRLWAFLARSATVSLVSECEEGTRAHHMNVKYYDQCIFHTLYAQWARSALCGYAQCCLLCTV